MLRKLVKHRQYIRFRSTKSPSTASGKRGASPARRANEYTPLLAI
jgi:hypothetical protein